MTRRRQQTSRPQKSDPLAAPPVTGWKLWRLRLCALIVVPLFFFALVELILRLTGFGYSTSFLLPSSNHGQETFVQNNQFGWRFFGPSMARLPNPFSISREKPADVIRIFVFGESAAYGDPQPHFGLPRMIEALLDLRHPGIKFEVVNAAMTGINSHAILPVARDCARAGGDVWVIYMGNNEVVGPFGAGTVFGLQAPRLPVVRANLALKGTRTGQLLDAALDNLHKTPAGKREWGGMRMFLNHQIRADNPRLANVYRNFENNLRDIIRAGHDSGAGVVVSTVGVNLSCAPFGSLQRASLTEAEKSKWERWYRLGIQAQLAGNSSEAVSEFRNAAEVDDTVAELHFRRGQCALLLGQVQEAREQFAAARDLDTLRFRCDSRLNEVIRQTACGRDAERILFADAERAFADQSQNGIPGEEIFYEHVHLTFGGNYLLARTISEQIEKLLPQKITTASKLWPSVKDCSRRLAWTDRDRQWAVSEILSRLTDPPFTGQSDHAARIQRLTALAEHLAPASAPAALRDDLEYCASAAAAWPQDAALLEQLALLKQAAGDLAAAEAVAKRSLDLLPSNVDGWFELGAILVREQKFAEAVSAYRRSLELDSQNVWALQALAAALVKLNRRDDALGEFRRALAIKPRFGPAWLGLGQLLETMDRKDEAQGCFQQALTNRIHRASDLATLARFCEGRGWHEAAATNYDDAIKLDASDARLRFEAGQALAALGRHAEAGRRYAEAAQLSPDFASAHFLWGVELGRAGKPDEATREFRAALRLMPDLMEAHLDLGIALAHDKKYSEALAEFEQVLQRNPTNTLALKYVGALRESR
jgi:tetratricopeptide (TPR) repeat protein